MCPTKPLAEADSLIDGGTPNYRMSSPTYARRFGGQADRHKIADEVINGICSGTPIESRWRRSYEMRLARGYRNKFHYPSIIKIFANLSESISLEYLLTANCLEAS